MTARHVFVAISFGLCFFLALLAPAMAALEPIGKIVTLRGTVKGAMAGSSASSALQANDHVFQGQTITSGEDGFAEIVFKDESIFSIGRNSEIILDTFIYNPDKGQGETVIDMTRGVFRFLSGAIGKAMPNKVRYKTPAATIGIRGSGAVVRIEPNGATQVVLTHCCVDISNDQGTTKLDNPLTYSVIASKGSKPTEPKPLPPAEKNKLLQEFGITPPSQDPATESPDDEGDTEQNTDDALKLQNILGQRDRIRATVTTTAKDGVRGSGRATGSIGIQVSIVESIYAEPVNGTSLTMNSQNFSGNETFCVFHNSGGNYIITALGSGAGRSFVFNDEKGNSIPYQVSWESTSEKVFLAPGKSSPSLSRGMDFNSTCDGSSQNARIRFRIPSEYREKFKQGNFSGEATIIIEAE